MGFFCGMAVKRVGQEVGYVIGLAFIGLQSLNYLGYINIDYKKVTKDAEKIMDADGDGKLSVNDALVIWKEARKMLEFHLPSAGGFSAGLALGLYWGR